MAADILRLADKLGPAKIIQVYEPTVNLRAVLVIDNLAMGPAMGGIRMAPDVSVEECFRLARTMTLKNAVTGLPHGGGKTVVYADSKAPKPEKERLIRALAAALRNVPDYIMGPDMGTDAECMAWIRDEKALVTGVPADLGGIPLDELGVTGWGIRHATEVGAQYCDLNLKGARLAVQGFGAVGKKTAVFLAEEQVILVGASDSQGAVYDPHGLDVDELVRLKEAGRSIIDYARGEKFDREAIVDFDCDIWVPAARPDVVTEANMHRLKAKLIVEGANIAITYGAEQYLHEKGVLVIPDIIANPGAVITSSLEYWGEFIDTEVLRIIKEKVRQNTKMVLEEATAKKIMPRDVAVQLAVARVEKAMSYKRWSIY
jgi:glutamate dehydrogenase (NAD(P)+)